MRLNEATIRPLARGWRRSRPIDRPTESALFLRLCDCGEVGMFDCCFYWITIYDSTKPKRIMMTILIHMNGLANEIDSSEGVREVFHEKISS